MRRADRAIFERPFGNELDSLQADDAVRQLLGVAIDEQTVLIRMLRADLDQQSHGISWWRFRSDRACCILVSDHLIAAAESVLTNLTECALHLLELEDLREEKERRLSRILSVDGTLSLPGPLCPADMLADLHEQMHGAAYFRAVGSVFDCLAATVIGIGAVPLDILRADFARTRRWLARDFRSKETRHAHHDELHKTIEDAVRTAGPAGWFEWSDDYRNMLIHRGRRMNAVTFKVEAHVLDRHGQAVPRTVPVSLLLREPAVSNIEAVIQAKHAQMYLSEPAMDTMRGVLSSASSVVRAVAKHLQALWECRRGEPTELDQPLREQWPRVATQPSQVFDGYAPGTIATDFSHMVVNPADAERMAASAIDPHHRHLWEKRPDESE